MTASLSIKPADDCRYDLVSLGEVMLRLDPGETRIRTTRSFQAWEGGGEYNVARGLRRCFGQRTAIVTAFAKNEVGRLLEDLILQGGVDTSLVRWVEDDGSGRTTRNGLNFTERGFGVRGALGCSDRGHTATSQLQAGDIDWEHLFGTLGVRWFHTGGIFAALSKTTAAVTQEAIQCARKHGTIVSYDLNYRPSLWNGIGGKERAQEVNREIVTGVDVLLGNEEDFSACLGLSLTSESEAMTNLDVENYKRMIEQAVVEYPNLRATATTLREAHTATVNDWKALVWHDGKFFESIEFPRLEIMDRVGGGDSFASGLIYGFLTADDPQRAVNLGTAHGALAMTTPGDTTMASLEEVERLIGGKGARIQR